MDSALYSLGKILLHSRVMQQHDSGVLEHMVTHQHSRPQRSRVRDQMPPAPSTQSDDTLIAAAPTEVASGVCCMQSAAVAHCGDCGPRMSSVRSVPPCQIAQAIWAMHCRRLQGRAVKYSRAAATLHACIDLSTSTFPDSGKIICQGRIGGKIRVSRCVSNEPVCSGALMASCWGQEQPTCPRICVDINQT